MLYVFGFLLCFVSPFIGVPILIFAIVRSLAGGENSSRGSGNYTGDGGGVEAVSHKLQFRLNDVELGEANNKFWAKEVQAKGLIPLQRTTKVGFITSVFDMTSGEPTPVLSTIDSFQEKESRVYQNEMDYGDVPTNQEFPNWARVGIVIPEILQPPRSGIRKVAVIMRMVDLNDRPEINFGFCDTEQSGLLWQDDITFSHTFKDIGYEEVTENHEESVALTVKVATAIAMSLGKLDESKGLVIKKWISQYIDIYTGEKKERLKALCNNALKEAYNLAKNNDLSMSVLTARFNEVGTNSEKYQAIELLFDVVGAGSKVNPAGIEAIRTIANALDLELDEVRKIHDAKIIQSDSNGIVGVSIESILGIEPHWDFDKIKKHLREEFQKWNNRLNTLTEGTERDNAQMMLDRIAEARKKYV